MLWRDAQLEKNDPVQDFHAMSDSCERVNRVSQGYHYVFLQQPIRTQNQTIKTRTQASQFSSIDWAWFSNSLKI